MIIKTDVDRNSWNDFVSSFDGPAILQSFEWGELKSKHGWLPIRLAIEDNGKIVAAIQILKRKIPYINYSMFYAPRGPVLDCANIMAFDFLLEAVEVEAHKHNAISFKIDPQVFENDERVKNLLKSRGFRYKKQNVQPRTTIIVNLEKDLEELLLTFEEKTRYNIRLSGKKGVMVKEASDDRGVDEFYEIYKETAKRNNFLIHPKSYYKNIKTCLVDRGLANIFIAYHRDIPIAGVFTFNFGSRSWYMYGASLNSSRNIMPNHALHWHIIKWAKEKGFKNYDLFGIPSNPTQTHPLWGVYRFKKGFNGDLIKYIGVYDLVYKPLLYALIENGIILYKNLRSLLLKGKISDSLEE